MIGFVGDDFLASNSEANDRPQSVTADEPDVQHDHQHSDSTAVQDQQTPAGAGRFSVGLKT